ncbi:pre-mRNA-splicing factor ISY1, partial [Tanacetum coccineum]
MKSSATWKMCWTVVQNDPSARLSKTNIFTVKGLFENPSELRKHRSRYDIYKRIEASYYGYRDDEDGVLEKVERGAEERMRATPGGRMWGSRSVRDDLSSRFLLASFLLPCNVIWKFPENNLDVLKFPDKNRWFDRGGGECGGGCEDKSVCAWEDKILSAFMVKKSAWREYMAGVFGGTIDDDDVVDNADFINNEDDVVAHVLDDDDVVVSDDDEVNP